MSDLKEISEKIKKFRADRDWDKYHNSKEDAIDLAVEAAEVLECFQRRTGKELEEYIKSHKKEIGDELADVLHALVSIADELQINLKDAFEQKMVQNEKKYPIEKSKGLANKYTELE